MPDADVARILEMFSVERQQQKTEIKTQDCRVEPHDRTALTTPLSWNPPTPDHPDSFFRSMRATMILGQCSTVLPVRGITGPNYKTLQFLWRDHRVVLLFLVFFGLLVMTIFSSIHWLEEGFPFDGSSATVFFTCNTINFILFLKMSTKWRETCRDFAEVEHRMRQYGYPKRQALKFKVILTSFMLVALVEHVLSRVMVWIRSRPCSRSNDIQEVLHAVFINTYQEIFSVVDYSLWKGLAAIFLHFLAAISWNFTDLFISLMSLSLSSRFSLFNKELLRVQGQDKPVTYWRRVREEYNMLSVLTKRVDRRLQGLMLLSMGDNLYFICLQLLKSLNKRINVYQIAYFFWSFGFLLFRTVFVALCAASVHDKSKESKTVLYSVPHTSYCEDSQRLLDQICNDDVALTGCRFFNVTRGLVLTIAGTVITYEIILMQFDSDRGGAQSWPSDGNKSLCVPF